MTLIKKPVGGSSVKYVKYSEAKPGDVIATGTFAGTSLVKAYDPKQADVPQHTIIDESGVSLKLNSAGQLNYLLKNVAEGSLIEVTYLGKEKIKGKNGKLVEANQFEVHELVEA